MLYGYVSGEKGCNVYFIRDGAGNIKIGVADDVKLRKDALQTAHANELEVFCIWRVQNKKDAFATEEYLHDLFKQCWKRGEWYNEKEVIEWLRNGNLSTPLYTFENVDW